MLETKNLKKSYKPKRGVAVDALKGVSLKFPERGMVFLLGKSGSGKSTLLNLLGGLDQYSEGEIIIKGVSSKTFSQSQFDSYRNTYVGFIFQEYNVLEEFTVGANIALAIELQGRKAEDEEINKILKTVDLDGLGNRKPNELSGGQKQRVAIARALVKNPQIIMADEPTGALDSNTGKQVLDTLKMLSKDKLVIVVSHDREFAENYGDRIIELADGEVINDVERRKSDDYVEDVIGIEFNDDGMVFSQGYHLTEEDRILINDYLSGKKEKVKAFMRGRKSGDFEKTDQSKIVHHDRVFQLIKSKLPLGNAVKIGASGLKHKKIRLVFTILLSFVAFSLFALADTFGSYDNVKTCTKSLIDSKVDYVSLSKKIINDENGYVESTGYFSDQDIKQISEKTGKVFKGVYVPDIDWELKNMGNVENLSETGEGSPYCTYYSGFINIEKEELGKYGYELVEGNLPKEKEEVAISSYCFETFKKAGYMSGTRNDIETISAYKDMIGKEIEVGKKTYKISGIFDTHMDIKRYKRVGKDLSDASIEEKLANYALSSELSTIKGYSLSGALVVSDEAMDEMLKNNFEKVQIYGADYMADTDAFSLQAVYVANTEDLDYSKVTWIDGEKKSLGKDEVIVASDCFYGETGELELKKIIECLKKNNEIEREIFEEDSERTEQKKIVGVINSEKNVNYYNVVIVSDNEYQKEWDVLKGSYEYIVTPMPSKESEIENLVRYSTELHKVATFKDDVSYEMNNSVTFELSAIDRVLKILSKGFMYVGLGFAVFAGLMLGNFIATSIAYKKQEIGILRAIGARSSDVFKIFSSESMIIALVNFILACVGTAFAVNFINNLIRMDVGILITILNFGWRQIVLLFVISVTIALISSFIPVYGIARKKPIDAIRNK